MTELLLGCGDSRAKRVHLGDPDWHDLITLDVRPDVGADVIWDLDFTPWPFADDEFDEVHAYEVLEHIGSQGDAHSFFDHFSEIWRILKPDGRLFASVPAVTSAWVWGDPGHRRVISRESLTFLDQSQYMAQVGKTAMTDYRSIYKGDLRALAMQTDGDAFTFILKAVKISPNPTAGDPHG
jgi:SAM-dependent methyltransferase